MPRLAVVVLGDYELSIVCVLLLGSVGESRRDVVTVCPSYATLKQRQTRHTLLHSQLTKSKVRSLSGKADGHLADQ